MDGEEVLGVGVESRRSKIVHVVDQLALPRLGMISRPRFAPRLCDDATYDRTMYMCRLVYTCR